jgi:hypothetical protein
MRHEEERGEGTRPVSRSRSHPGQDTTTPN